MSATIKLHSFYIPVMGTGFTIDTPLRVGRYGINSVISLVDDELIEEARRYYSTITGEHYTPIGKEYPDSRAERIRCYLDLCDRMVAKEIASVIAQEFGPDNDVSRFFELLPDTSPARALYDCMLVESDVQRRNELKKQLRAMIIPGTIDVNIMTELDCNKWVRKKKLPADQSDAMAALRGFALSTVNSSVIFSAGFNRSLYTYLEQFPGFYPDKSGIVNKHVIIKVSDYRSAIAQGRFLAKKGIWIDEFRIESGLNCGGHAFATAGILLGPVMDEFRSCREELKEQLFGVYRVGMNNKGFDAPQKPPPQKITVQGGITSSSEHRLMLSHYCADAAGWGTPFLLVPEATRVEPEIISALSSARAEDIKLSKASPMNVPFSNLLTSKSENSRKQKIKIGKPGVVCKHGHLAFNTEFSEKPVCTASAFYQTRKLKAVETDLTLTNMERQASQNEITEKACLCLQLSGSAMRAFGAEGAENIDTAICPGPNIIHFKRAFSLKEMVGHIYGKIDIVKNPVREHFLLTEIRLYLAHLSSLIKEFQPTAGVWEVKKINDFLHSLKSGITSYMSIEQDRFEETIDRYELFRDGLSKAMNELETLSAHFTKISCVSEVTLLQQG